MKNKKIILVVSCVVILIIAAIVSVLLINLFNKNDALDDGTNSNLNENQKSDLNEIVGDTISLENATTYVYELTNDLDDDFSQAFMEKTTLKIIEVDKDSEVATVEFCVPDIEKIMLSNLPADEGADYDTLFETYCSKVNEAIANADAADMITQTIECPIIADTSGSKISIEGAPLLNYQNILADILIKIISGSEAEQ